MGLENFIITAVNVIFLAIFAACVAIMTEANCRVAPVNRIAKSATVMGTLRCRHTSARTACRVDVINSLVGRPFHRILQRNGSKPVAGNSHISLRGGGIFGLTAPENSSIPDGTGWAFSLHAKGQGEDETK